MPHLSDGTLRHLIDEPEGVDAAARDHAATCGECRDRGAAIAAEADRVRASLSGPAMPPPDPAAALAAVRGRTTAAGSGRTGWTPGRRVAAGAAAAAAIVLLVAFTPLRSVAQGFLAIFEPSQIVAVPISRADIAALRALPDLGAYGTVRQGAQPVRATVADSRSAALIAGMPVRVPGYLPSGFQQQRPTYMIQGRTTGTFTFSAAKAAAAASAQGAALPPMPARLDGSTLVASLGPVVVATYGIHPSSNGTFISGRFHRHGGAVSPLHLAIVVIAQAPAPRVSSTGASAHEIESYLLSLPGVPPQLAGEIRAIGDPSTTLPIPVPVDRETAQSVMVQGVQGLGILDNTGLGSGVVWQRDGMIYAVAGAMPARDVLAVANSLH